MEFFIRRYVKGKKNSGTFSGVAGLFRGVKYNKFKNNNFYIVFSFGSLVSGLYLINYFKEYSKQV